MIEMVVLIVFIVENDFFELQEVRASQTSLLTSGRQ